MAQRGLHGSNLQFFGIHPSPDTMDRAGRVIAATETALEGRRR